MMSCGGAIRLGAHAASGEDSCEGPAGPVTTTHPPRATKGPRRLSVVLLVLVVVVGGVACGRADRPAIAAWQETWETAQRIVPPPDTLQSPPRTETCDRVVASLRSIRGELLPSPDPLVDERVDDWLSSAESVFFECFDTAGPGRSVETAYAHLERLRAEVETALDTVRPADSTTGAAAQSSRRRPAR